MATYGAKYARFAPFSGAEPEAKEKKMPAYGDVLDLGPLNQTSDNLSFTEASSYGDNARKIYIRKFQSGTVTAVSVDVSAESLGKIYGCDVGEDGSMAHGGADGAPYGGYGFFVNRIDEAGNEYFQPIFYPKVKGGPNGSTTYDTRGENITIALDTIQFAVSEASCGKYKIEGPRFKAEQEAMEWIDNVFAGKAEIPGLSPSEE